jgi:hypothetical protein
MLYRQSGLWSGIGVKRPWCCIYRVLYGLMYGISEKRPWCCIDRVLYGLELVWKDHDVVYTESGLWSHVWNWHEETMLLYRQIEWSLVSCMKLVRRDHDVYTVVYGLMYGISEKRPWCCIYRVVYGLMYGIGMKRPCCCIDRYNDPWSHVWNWWEETMMYIQWSMVSCMELVWRDHGVV